MTTAADWVSLLQRIHATDGLAVSHNILAGAFLTLLSSNDEVVKFNVLILLQNQVAQFRLSNRYAAQWGSVGKGAYVYQS